MKRSTKIEFVEKAIKVHGEKYIYADGCYINERTPTKIICSEHGEFYQIPYSHLSGSGCPVCGLLSRSYKRRKSLKQFIKDANKVHKGRYEYPDYPKNALTKIIIVCKEHGAFLQTPNSHLEGHGCIKCSYIERAKNRLKTNEQFVKEANEIHGNRYEYPEEYVNSEDKISIMCSVHGIFEQQPWIHLGGHGCPGCKKSIGENRIMRNLRQRSVKFINQYRVDNIFSNSPKYFWYDIYIPKLNIIIEFDGEQHSKFSPYFHKTPDGFKKLLKYDDMKNRIAKYLKIKLIRIPHTGINSIEQILENIF